MVDDCVTMGLKIPEFTQDSNFRVIIWRKNGLTSGKNDLSSEQNGLTSVKNNPNIKANLSKKPIISPLKLKTPPKYATLRFAWEAHYRLVNELFYIKKFLQR